MITGNKITWVFSPGNSCWTAYRNKNVNCCGWVSGSFNEDGSPGSFKAYKDDGTGTVYLGWVATLKGAKTLLELAVKNNANLDNITNR